MTEIVAFPLAEAVVVTYLSFTLPDAWVATKVPNPRWPLMVRVGRAGGTRRDLVTDRPMITVECWGETPVDAADLARLARAHVWAMPGQMIAGVWVRRCVEVSGPQSYPDPETTLPRYQFTVQLDLRGEVLP